MPDWFLNDNGHVISEDTKRREVMKSMFVCQKIPQKWHWKCCCVISNLQIP